MNLYLFSYLNQKRKLEAVENPPQLHIDSVKQLLLLFFNLNFVLLYTRRVHASPAENMLTKYFYKNIWNRKRTVPIEITSHN